MSCRATPDCIELIVITAHWCQQGTSSLWCAPAGLTEQACSSSRPGPPTKADMSSDV